MQLSVAQCRSGRALLGWSLGDLAKAADLGIMTLNRFEGGQAVSSASLDKIAHALTAAGITFIAPGEASLQGGEGVRLVRPAQTAISEG
jgi:transcriptional regulator with XRE-family HTH domain